MYNMHNIVEKLFSIIIAPVRSRGGSLVNNNYKSESQIGVRIGVFCWK
jgi:hypothetical protein